MMNLKTWIKRNESLNDYDNPAIDPDKVLNEHRKAVTQAKTAIRSQLEQQFKSALMEFYSNESFS